MTTAIHVALVVDSDLSSPKNQVCLPAGQQGNYEYDMAQVGILEGGSVGLCHSGGLGWVGRVRFL